MSEGGRDQWSKVRHDLRTPINQIIGYSELLQEEAEDAGQAGLLPDLQKVTAAARRLLALLDEHLSPGAIEAMARAAAAAPAPPGGGAAPAVAAAPPAAGEPAQAPVAEHAPAVAPPPKDERHGPQTLDRLGSKEKDLLLVVDDNEMNRDMLSRRLRAKGFEVETSEDGYQALERVAKGGVDLLLLDVMMPGISGYEVLTKLRETHSSADLPIIMATAKDQSEDIVGALKSGANDYVVKPLDFPVVLARVVAQLTIKKAKEQVERLASDLEKTNRFIRNTFGRYLSEEIVSSILESPEGLKLGGERRTVTILMSDLRGFTAIAERLAPEQVVLMLNHYLGAMADVIMKHRGTIDEFIGDAVLAIFGAPVQRDDDARRAVACATEMQLAMAAVNEWNREQGLPAVEMGIALHTGEVVVGNIGSEKRAKYGVVGTTINLTSRIETYTVGGQILISEATQRAAGPDVRLGGQMLVRAKGAREPLTAYDLRGIGGAFDLFLPAEEHTTVQLQQPIEIRFFTIDGKAVSDEARKGLLVRVSMKGADVASDVTLPATTNVKIHLIDGQDEEVPGDLYAKVIEKAGASGAFAVRFTSMPPEVEVFLKRRLGA
ncbi:MAG: adenylate/guanylate cyclase domain-containing protein [Vicinamibacteria bacterium]